MMLYLLASVLCSAMLCSAQQNPEVDSLIAETKVYLEIYSSLSPFGEVEAYTDIGLPERDIATLRLDSEEYEYIGNDSIESFEIISYIQSCIELHIRKIVRRADLNQCDLVEIFKDYQIGVVRSSDGKLYNFSLDEKTGGSYRSRLSWMHYTELETDTLDLTLNDGESSPESPYYTFETNGYHRIDTLHSGDQIKYVLTGSVLGCTACFLTYVEMVKFENGQFINEFYYSVESRSWETEVVFDLENKTIKADYLTDDLTTDCGCEVRSDFENGNYDYSQDEEPEYDLECHCEFVFDGENFVEVGETVK